MAFFLYKYFSCCLPAYWETKQESIVWKNVKAWHLYNLTHDEKNIFCTGYNPGILRM